MQRLTQYSSHAGFIVDRQSIDLEPGRQIDWGNVGSKYYSSAVPVVVGAAGAAAAATTVPVAALAAAIPAGALIDFGTNKFARLTAAAAAGATSLTTAAIPTALVSGDTGYYWPAGNKRVIPGGTAMGELIDITAGGPGKISPRVLTTNPAIGLLASDAVEDDPIAPKTGYGLIRGGEVYDALLPDSTGSPRVLPTAIKTELNANSKGFLFFTYKDVR